MEEEKEQGEEDTINKKSGSAAAAQHTKPKQNKFKMTNELDCESVTISSSKQKKQISGFPPVNPSHLWSPKRLQKENKFIGFGWTVEV